MRSIALFTLPVLAAAVGGMTWAQRMPYRSSQPFPHDIHESFFDCTACHGGLTEVGGAHFPEPTFCATCHNGTIQVTVSWQPPDPRPQSNPRFSHAGHIALAGNECSDCHVMLGQLPLAQPCRDCHSQAEQVYISAVVHGSGFRDRHASEAAASPDMCANCHLRADCLDCHRPDPGSGSPGYHAANFLAEHATASYSRGQSCSDCHNARVFCASCHVQSGLTSAGDIGARFHSAEPNFVAGHGRAARQSLESCVACHSENDCLACHSPTSGRISPHGPGFDAERLREKNPSMCVACHVSTIPGGG